MAQPPTLIRDTYGANHQLKNILTGKSGLNNYQKHFVMDVVIHYSKLASNGNSTPESEWLETWIGKHGNDYDRLLQALGGSSVELLFAYALLAFKRLDNTLLIKTANIFGRPLTMDRKNEWLDNWRLNAPGYAYTMITWDGVDNENTYNVKHQYDPSSVHDGAGGESVSTNDWHNMVKFIVNPVRAFMFTHNTFPFKYSLPKPLAENDYKGIVHACYRVFPFSYLNSGGCDMHDNSYTASIPVVSKYMKIFGNAMLAAIENTATFRSASGGAHWMCLFFMNNTASLICSQASGWQILKDSGALYKQLTAYFGTQNNLVEIQKDTCNCGLYSLLSIYKMIVNDGNMLDAVKSIGENARLFGTSAADTSRDNMIFHIKATLFGTPE